MNTNKLFNEGKFEQAKKHYLKILETDQENFEVLKQLGKIALYSNRFTEAENFLIRAINQNSKEKEVYLLLYENYYRQDKFEDAVKILNKIESFDEARRLDSFKEKPNKITGTKDITYIPFQKTDPLPLIQVIINDEKVNFLIDTGAAETIIDSDFADELGLEIFYSREGIFAGGKKASVKKSKIASIILGDFRINNLPVAILPVRNISDRLFGGIQIDGIIGTTLFYHFITTMDYRKEKLILRKISDANLNEIYKNNNIIEVPFWMAGDHFIVSWGNVNESKPMLFFVDTGLAGGGFTCPESTLKEANIELNVDQSSTGIGGGGKVQIIPFTVDKICLGDAIEENIRGIYAPSGGNLSDMLGFHIGGIISHAFFRNYSLTFDFINMKLLLEKKEG